MAANLLINALLFGGIFVLLGLVRGDVGTYAAFGVMLGLVLGAQQHRRSKRVNRYRSQFDPPGPTLTPGSLAPPSVRPPAVTRYRVDRTTIVGLSILLVASVALAIWQSLSADQAWQGLLFWCLLVAPFALMVWMTLATYTEVGPSGIRLRTPFRARRFSWPELAEVGWLRTGLADLVVLSTQDGRRVKTVGIAVSAIGGGRDRALRMLADIEHHWASSDAQISAASPGTATSIRPS